MKHIGRALGPFFLLFMLILTSTSSQAGAPLWSFQPLTATTLTVPLNDSATVQYKVTNRSSKQVQLQIQPIQGISASGCDSVAPAQSCTLTLVLNGAALASSTSGGPVLCNQFSPQQCYRPNSNDELQITRGSAVVVPLSILGLPMLLTPNTTGFVTVTNTGTKTANNIRATLPAGIAAYVTQDASNCIILLPGQSCQLSFTVNNVGYPATTISIAGSNTTTEIGTLTLISQYFVTGGNDVVYALKYDEAHHLLYVGGDFTTINGVARSNIAAIDTTTGFITNWAPNADGAVEALELDSTGTVVYAGGFYNNIGGQARNNLAALEASSGAATGWVANADGPVFALKRSNSTLYVGGAFANIGGQARNTLAALEASSGGVLGWNPGVIGNNVLAITVSGSTVYVGGEVFSIGGQARPLIGAIDATSGIPTSWDPGGVGILVYAILTNGSTVYAVGEFTDMGGLPRNNFAELYATGPDAGTATPFDPNPDQQTNSLALSGSTLYIGGEFTNIGGQAQNGVAAFDTVSGLMTNWNPQLDNGAAVYAMAVVDASIFVGGYFTTINGFPALLLGSTPLSP